MSNTTTMSDENLEEMSSFVSGNTSKELPDRTRSDAESEEVTCFVPETSGTELASKTSPYDHFCRRIQSDSDYRQKFLDTVCLWIAEFVFGFVYGQPGPTLPDLQQITQVDLDTASWLFTAFSLGYIFGCFLSAFLEKKTSPRLSMFVCLLGMAVFTIATPWCSAFGLMVAARACAGVFYGGVDVGGHAFIFTIWRQEANTYLQVYYFTLATGCLVAPFATTPFLSERIDQSAQYITELNQSETIATTVSFHGYQSDAKLTDSAVYTSYSIESNNNYSSWDTAQIYSSYLTETHVHYSFLICGILTVCASLPFLLIHIMKPNHRYIKTKEYVPEKNDKKQPTKIVFSLAIIILTILLSIRTGWTSTFTGFLTSYCSRHLGWTKPKGNLMTSLFFIAYAVGSLLCVLLVQCLRPGTMLISFLLCFNVSLVGFTAASIYFSETSIWICVFLMGFALSATWPAVLSWTEEKVTPITGKIASLLLFSGAVGQMVNPIAVGYLMDNVSNSSFAFWHLGEAIFIIILFVTVAGLYWNVDTNKLQHNKDIDIKGT